MSVVRGVKDRRFKFTQLLNVMLEDPKLSLKAKGFIAYCLTKPVDWTFNIKHLCSVLKEKDRAIYAAMNECIEQGYAYRSQPRDEKGRFLDDIFLISDSKHEIEELKKEVEVSVETKFKKCLPDSGFADADSADADNASLSNIIYSNTEVAAIEPPPQTPEPPIQKPPAPKSAAAASFEELEKYTILLTEEHGLNLSPFALKKSITDFGSEVCKKVIQIMKLEQPDRSRDKTRFFVSMCKGMAS